MISRCTWLIGFIYVKNDQHPRPRSSSAAETRENPKSCLQKFVFAAPQLPSTGPNLLGERWDFPPPVEVVDGQPISVEALERPVEENRPPPNSVEGAGTGPICHHRHYRSMFVERAAPRSFDGGGAIQTPSPKSTYL